MAEGEEKEQNCVGRALVLDLCQRKVAKKRKKKEKKGDVTEGGEEEKRKRKKNDMMTINNENSLKVSKEKIKKEGEPSHSLSSVKKEKKGRLQHSGGGRRGK